MATTKTPDRVTIERTFPAPPEAIWTLWTLPEHFASWYGPEGSTVPVAEMDVRVGGTRLLCMEVQTPQGPRRMWFTGPYLEGTVNKRLVYTDAMSMTSAPSRAPLLVLSILSVAPASVSPAPAVVGPRSAGGESGTFNGVGQVRQRGGTLAGGPTPVHAAGGAGVSRRHRAHRDCAGFAGGRTCRHVGPAR